MKTATLDARAVMDAATTEAAFRLAVTALMTKHGWRWSYIPDSRQVQGFRGIPDLIAVRDDRLLFVEIKRQRGRMRPDQVDWAIALDMTRKAEVYEWRPSNWELIKRVLA